MVWSPDGWLRTADGQGLPTLTVAAPDLLSHPFPASPQRNNFTAPVLPIDFQWLRTPYPARLFSLTERPGYLRLFGRETLGSQFEQALVARRQQAFCFTATTRMEFQPEHFQQAAGLILYYHATKFHYLFLTQDDNSGRHLRVMSCVTDVGDTITAPVSLPDGTGNLELRMDVDYERLLFAYRLPGGTWQMLPQIFDASIVSDEAGPPTAANFTGAFIGVCCQDTSGTRRPADFDFFEYRERAYQPQVWLSNPELD
jgi:xylan 1,4-beta-xylosidase